VIDTANVDDVANKHFTQIARAHNDY